MDSCDRGQSLGETLQKTHQGTRHGVASASCQTMMAWGIVGAGRSSTSRLVVILDILLICVQIVADTL